MRFEREYANGLGQRFKAVITIGEDLGQKLKLEKALQALANKARGQMRGQTTALGGAVHCIVHPIK